jgi:hypothetical protein
VDQVADALRLGNRGSAEALPDLDHCARSVKSWLADRRVVEVAGVRNDATHAYYDKRPQGELWHLWSSRRGSPVDRGDILSFARRAVVHLRDLRPLLECMRRSVQRDVGP